MPNSTMQGENQTGEDQNHLNTHKTFLQCEAVQSITCCRHGSEKPPCDALFSVSVTSHVTYVDTSLGNSGIGPGRPLTTAVTF